MIDKVIENLPWILACLLGISEALAFIPQLKSNSVLQLVINALKKAEPVVAKLEKKQEEPKSEEQK